MEKKNKKILIWVIAAFITLSLILIGYIIYNKSKANNNISDNEDNNLSEQIPDNKEDNNKYQEDTKYEVKDVTLDFQKEKTNNYMEVGFGLLGKLTEDKYKINLTINNIKINETTHSIKIENYEPNDYECEKGKDRVVYFDNKVIYEPVAQGCYLSSLYKIIIFKNQYIIMEMSKENDGWVHIFNEFGTEIKLDDNITVARINEVTENSIKFTGWDKEDENIYCKDNEYELKIENNTASYKLIKTGLNEYCP